MHRRGADLALSIIKEPWQSPVFTMNHHLLSGKITNQYEPLSITINQHSPLLIIINQHSTIIKPFHHQTTKHKLCSCRFSNFPRLRPATVISLRQRPASLLPRLRRASRKTPTTPCRRALHGPGSVRRGVSRSVRETADHLR